MIDRWLFTPKLTTPGRDNIKFTVKYVILLLIKNKAIKYLPPLQISRDSK